MRSGPQWFWKWRCFCPPPWLKGYSETSCDKGLRPASSTINTISNVQTIFILSRKSTTRFQSIIFLTDDKGFSIFDPLHSLCFLFLCILSALGVEQVLSHKSQLYPWCLICFDLTCSVTRYFLFDEYVQTVHCQTSALLSLLIKVAKFFSGSSRTSASSESEEISAPEFWTPASSACDSESWTPAESLCSSINLQCYTNNIGNKDQYTQTLHFFRHRVFWRRLIWSRHSGTESCTYCDLFSGNFAHKSKRL